MEQLFQYTDFGNAKRWAFLFQEKFKWIPELKTWFLWNGARWEDDITGRHVCNVDRLLDDIDNDRALLLALNKEQPENQHAIDELLKQNQSWRKSSQAMSHIHAMTKLARSQPGVSQSYTAFDSKGHFIGVQNGIINLETGEFVTDQPQYYITKCCNAVYDPEAECPEWEQFLMRIFEGDRAKVAFIQRLIGQALLGTSEKSKLVIFCGNGANGKSTLVDTIITLLGDYAKNTSAGVVTESKHNKEYYLAELKGVRLTVINESKRGAYLDEELVKSLVDSGEIQARQIYKAPITFQPVATPIFTTNYPPRISADYSISRRLIYVPFSFQLPMEERDPKFRTDVLEKELSGILNWALDGCRQYQEQGLNPPTSIIDATNAYVHENDRTGRFIDERCAESPAERTKLEEIKNAYLQWSEQKGYRDITEDRIANDLRSRGFRVEKRNGGYYYVLGLRLRRHNELGNDLLSTARAMNNVLPLGNPA